MAARPRFRLNTPQVVAETIEDEAIVVNLTTGTYYSVKGDSILLWNAIVSGATVEEIAAVAAELTTASRETVAAAVGGFCDSLLAQGLIVARDADHDTAAEVDLSGGGEGLLEPTFETYADMKDLILLDPVHEVDERGWPHAQPAG
jgi:hypothetical protein